MRKGIKLLAYLYFYYFQSAVAQTGYPQNYFLFPLNPGVQAFLSGNTGEIRPNHFHAGLDVTTNQKVGIPVLAAADGYVSRIKVSTFGYGHALYVTHANGFTTVYAHLERYRGNIRDYVRKKQYEKNSFEIELFPEKNALRVHKGDTLGYSGNTGSSGGPHLHFEIRDTKTEEFIDPLLFGFNEVRDNSAPVVQAVALRTFGLDSRVYDEFGRKAFSPTRNGNKYVLSDTITAWGVLGLEIKATDYQGSASNPNGISGMELRVNGKDIFTYKMERCYFDETRNINVHIDYERYIEHGERFQRAYRAEGNKLRLYKTSEANGRLVIDREAVYDVVLGVSDALGNKSFLTFTILGKKPFMKGEGMATAAGKNSSTADPVFDFYDDIVKISAKAQLGDVCVIATDKTIKTLTPSYSLKGNHVWLYDADEGLPQSFTVGNKTVASGLIRKIMPGVRTTVKEGNISIQFSEESLFNTLYFSQPREIVNKNGKTTYVIGKQTVPLADYIYVSIVPSENDLNKAKTAVYSVSGTGRLSYEGGTWENGKITFKTKSFGRYTLATDLTKPTVKLVRKSGKEVVFSISDALSGIDSYKAYINARPLIMKYDFKTGLLVSEKMSDTTVLNGELMLYVTDKAGNKTIYTINID